MGTGFVMVALALWAIALIANPYLGG
jgi:hypothetical protein